MRLLVRSLLLEEPPLKHVEYLFEVPQVREIFTDRFELKEDIPPEIGLIETPSGQCYQIEGVLGYIPSPHPDICLVLTDQNLILEDDKGNLYPVGYGSDHKSILTSQSLNGTWDPNVDNKLLIDIMEELGHAFGLTYHFHHRDPTIRCVMQGDTLYNPPFRIIEDIEWCGNCYKKIMENPYLGRNR